MEEFGDKPVSYEVAKLAHAAGFKSNIGLGHCKPKGQYYNCDGELNGGVIKEIKSYLNKDGLHETISAPTHDALHAWIRQNRGVLICIYNNASGYLWSLSKVPGGTDLGYSEYAGPNNSGVWDEYDDAFEHALKLVLTKSLDDFYNETPKELFHWGNYADFLIKNG
jgi:hypothetical protein